MEIYIEPTCSVYSTYQDLSNMKYDWSNSSNLDNPLKIMEKEKYLYILWEPWFGKSSLLLRKLSILNSDQQWCYIHISFLLDEWSSDIDKYIDSQSLWFLNIDQATTTEEISKICYKTKDFVKMEWNWENMWVMLDWLDEIDYKKIPFIISMIRKISKKYPDLNIFVAWRTHIFKWYWNDLKQVDWFKYLEIQPLNRHKIYQYISKTLWDWDKDVINKLKFFYDDLSHIHILQVPRYLRLTLDYLQHTENRNKNYTITKSVIFKHFLEQKLDLERTRAGKEIHSMYREFLKNFALWMTESWKSTISIDEFIKDYKFIWNVNDLYQKTILKKFHDTNEISFDHQELQEYLTAQAILDKEKPVSYIFEYCIDPITLHLDPK